MLENVNARSARRPSLGQILDNENELQLDGGSGIVDVPYEVVNTSAPTPSATVLQTMQANTPVPVFNFNTSEASCNDCNATATVPTTTLPATTTSATATTNVVPSKVTPMEEAPKTTNWLLIGAIVGFSLLMYKTSTPGLGNVPEPAPTPEPKTLGRPPRRPEPKAPRHVKELTIS